MISSALVWQVQDVQQDSKDDGESDGDDDPPQALEGADCVEDWET